MRDQTSALVSETSSDETGMQTIRGHTGIAQAASKFAREQDIAESSGRRFSLLRSSLLIEGLEIQSSTLMRGGSRVDDACGSRG